MNLEEIKEGMKCFDTDCPQFGQGRIMLVEPEDDLVEVVYMDIEDIVQYTMNEANTHLHLLL